MAKESEESLNNSDIARIGSADILKRVSVKIVSCAAKTEKNITKNTVNTGNSSIYGTKIELCDNDIFVDILLLEHYIYRVKKCRRILFCGQNRSISKVVLCQRIILISLISTCTGCCR